MQDGGFIPEKMMILLFCGVGAVGFMLALVMVKETAGGKWDENEGKMIS